MNEIVKLYNNNPVRIVEKDGDPWFVAKDVCSILELDISSGARGLADDEKGLHTVQTPGGEQKLQVISEPGLYRLVFKSRKKKLNPSNAGYATMFCRQSAKLERTLHQE
jgi:prophage antirepressor-like protein